MNLCEPFLRRPVGTTLLTAGLLLSGIAAYFFLPVSPLPQVDFPTIQVSAQLPGASPETMGISVAEPLEKHLGVIADVTEMTSQSRTGQTQITLQFDLNRDIDGAARDVEAAINAARVDLPSTLRSNPTYRKVNPAEAPIMILALTSRTKTLSDIYDEVSNVIEQRLLQVDGVGNVELGGASLPAVRVDVVPYSLSQYGISLDDVRAALNSANPNRPKGVIENESTRYQVYTNDTGRSAVNFRNLVVAWRNKEAVRLKDVAHVYDGVEDIHNMGLFDGEPAIIVIVTRQPNANIIQTVDGIKAILPQLRADLPRDITLSVASDRTISIRGSLHEVETTLLIALLLVVVVTSLFLSSIRATLIPAVAVVSSLLGTIGVMYLVGFSLNNLSLMALTVATGFVVDDAIVVLENVSRHLEAGMGRFQAALTGTREVGFTVLSISISLVAVFIPLIFMGGIVGRLFREFAVTLSSAVLISLVVSLTTTAMMCAFVLRPGKAPAPDAAPRPANAVARLTRGVFDRTLAAYGRALDWSLEHAPVMLVLLLGVIALNVYLYIVAPKGFFPQQDTGSINCGIRADQSISFQATQEKLRQVIGIIAHDPAVEHIVGFTGGTRAGTAFMFATLKPRSVRHESGQQVIARLRPKLDRVTGLRIFMNPVQDMQIGGRQANASYQYTLQADNVDDLRHWATLLANQMKLEPAVTDVDTDQEEHGLESYVNIDRDSASRLGIAAVNIDNILYDAFGQELVATIYSVLNQYHVAMVVDSRYTAEPSALNDVYVETGQAAVPSGGLAATAAGNASGASAFGATSTTSSTGGAGGGGAISSAVSASVNALTIPGAPAMVEAATPGAPGSTLGGGSLPSNATGTVAGGITALTSQTPSSTTTPTSETSGTSTMTENAPSTAAVTAGGGTTGLSSPSAGGGATGTGSAGVAAASTATTCGNSPTAINPTSANTIGAITSTTATSSKPPTSVPVTITTASKSGLTAPPPSPFGSSCGSPPAAPILEVRNASTGNAVSTTPDTMVPLSAIARFTTASAPVSVNHQNTSLATTIAFNLAPGYALSDAAAAFADAENAIEMPAAIHGSFQGTARTFQSSVGDEPVLIAAALFAIYIVLGILYESYVHPFTVLSTLPSAGVGAVLALLLFHMEFSIIALIGVILLIGIVKKNAILIIDFALDGERTRGLAPRQAIREACMLRFRPILMTTLAAALGALPLAIGFGEGAELRQPLGVSIVGGLLVSQLLTLFTTPVVYLYLDKLRRPGIAEQDLGQTPDGAQPEAI
ncbi:MAG TPA: efflux RND transporter permease subunit [Steroidobacteraceae bacterium]|nr:efflux RND transporter permease subunit [Steroidobacteraceae bacterium]